MKRILVCGPPGAGKTTWVRENIGKGLAFDLDCLAAAFRCADYHAEIFPPARDMANDLLPGFLLRAGDYTDRLLVIRCFPSPDEIDEIDPDRIVICRKQHVKRYCDLRHKLKSLDEIRKYAAARGIPVLELD